jgi:hypothetical protein
VGNGIRRPSFCPSRPIPHDFLPSNWSESCAYVLELTFSSVYSTFGVDNARGEYCAVVEVWLEDLVAPAHRGCDFGRLASGYYADARLAAITLSHAREIINCAYWLLRRDTNLNGVEARAIPATTYY